MPVIAVVGALWGDEGKGHIVDYLSREAEIVMRVQGGDNAGHTVVNEYGTFRLHLVPSGVFHPGTTCIIGAGTVVNPDTLLQELAELEAAGVDTSRVWISDRAHLVFPYHRQRDELEERGRGDRPLGTTRRGIGPAYSDKAARIGLRMGDLLYRDWLHRRLQQAYAAISARMVALNGEPPSLEELIARCEGWREHLKDRIIDTIPMLQEALRRDARVLLEGQLGAMRDLDWGIYPYVTSSNTLVGYAAVGAGIPPRAIQEVIGVVKAFATAVGEGPLVTEVHGELAERLRRGGPREGWEFGATTGRPRRCGWPDGVALRHAAWLNGFTALAVTKLDVLDGLEEIPLCVGYRLPSGEVLTHVPDTPVLEQVTPVYERLPGWTGPTSTARRWQDLPEAAQGYLRRLAELAGAPVRYVSVGPARDQILEVM
ncbi:adenylosuccinate synthase [Thermoflexus sp.]|uniref:adenylosuccinate synthase n=1 Tax=Thermoflexus sp. TaxID=1969742 RepID=UPI002601571B|nr:adenylosuccinate synthase [Thermoflexus sp.]MDW8181068.1 adenylosuccinate synthase [Anaerolineae bacterium]MCS6963098.1 adenylosuccinate synthase [Thermoflexus sp.]MCS7351610.1 adenylosuccinate synthase [Thermoflexus sp.]MCX7689764.1 adenylosuccinate synthase [Thermoflexus sp.]MDW8184086.1 adenylosuccinate synthase [Anaerolineae bacterium]